MEVEIISKGDPLVLVGRIPASCGLSRAEKEHEAGIHLLEYGIKYLEIPNYSIKENYFGKPFFDNANGPFFNISHSNRMVACAFSKKEIGCDIEKIKTIPKILDKEIEKVLSFALSTDFSSSIGRTELWTIYEAMAKCIGKGIPIDVNEIKKNNWKVNSWIIEKTYILSIAQNEMKNS